MALLKKKKRFPTLAAIVFIVALLWFLSGLGVIAVDIPWLPLVVLIIALGWIVNYYTGK